MLAKESLVKYKSFKGKDYFFTYLCIAGTESGIEEALNSY